MAGTATEVSTKATVGKTTDLLDMVLQKISKLHIKYLWIPAEHNPSDFNSKSQQEPTQRSTSDLWRKGADFFIDATYLESIVLGKVCPQIHIFQLTQDQTDQTMTTFLLQGDLIEDLDRPTKTWGDYVFVDEIDGTIETVNRNVGNETEGKLKKSK